MSKPDDGGPAFPVPLETELRWSGMKLRDWFAAQSLIALMSSAGWVKGLDESCTMSGVPLKQGLAISAYQMADYMLAERQKGGSDGS